jgi:hypothetical protein
MILPSLPAASRIKIPCQPSCPNYQYGGENVKDEIDTIDSAPKAKPFCYNPWKHFMENWYIVMPYKGGNPNRPK